MLYNEAFSGKKILFNKQFLTWILFLVVSEFMIRMFLESMSEDNERSRISDKPTKALSPEHQKCENKPEEILGGDQCQEDVNHFDDDQKLLDLTQKGSSTAMIYIEFFNFKVL